MMLKMLASIVGITSSTLVLVKIFQKKETLFPSLLNTGGVNALRSRDASVNPLRISIFNTYLQSVNEDDIVEQENIW